MTKPQKVQVVQNPENEIPAKILAESIVKISEFTKALRSAGLKDRALILLINDISGVPMSNIRAVLCALEDLSATYVSKKSSK